MAGLGSIFVELELDRSKFDASLRKLETDAKSMPLAVEEAFKNLGVKSSYQFDLLREKAVMNFERIKNAANVTANDRLRAEQAMHAQLTRLNEEQFGKQVSLLGQLKSHWLAASVAITAAMTTAYKGWTMAKAGAEFEEQRGLLDNLTQKYDMSADAIVASMERASDGLIARADLMQIALGGIAKGLKPEQLTDLADAARILGDAAGKDATTALRELTEALETGRTKSLKGYLGATIDLGAAFGDLESKMTDAEKAQALYAITMLEATKLQAQQTKEVDSAADRLERLEAQYKNVTTSAAQYIKTLVVGAADLAGKTFTWSVPMEESLLETGGMTPAEIEARKAQGQITGPNMTEIDKAKQRYQAQIDALKKTVAARKTEKAGKEQEDPYYTSFKAQQSVLDEAYALAAKFRMDEAKREEDAAKDRLAIATEEAKLRVQIEVDEAKTTREAWEAYYQYLKTQQELQTKQTQQDYEDTQRRLEWQEEEQRIEREAWEAYYKLQKDAASKTEDEWRRSMFNIRGVAEDAFAGVSGAVSTAIRGVIQGTQTIEQAFKRMGENIVLGVMDSLVNRAIGSVSTSIVDLLFGKAGGGGSFLPQALSAAGGFLSSAGSAIWSGISSIGSFLGLFDTGLWKVPEGKAVAAPGGSAWKRGATAGTSSASGWAILHPGEMIVPPEVAEKLRRMVALTGGSNFQDLAELLAQMGGAGQAGGTRGPQSTAEALSSAFIGSMTPGWGLAASVAQGINATLAGLRSITSPMSAFGTLMAAGEISRAIDVQGLVASGFDRNVAESVVGSFRGFSPGTVAAVAEAFGGLPSAVARSLDEASTISASIDAAFAPGNVAGSIGPGQHTEGAPSFGEGGYGEATGGGITGDGQGVGTSDTADPSSFASGGLFRTTGRVRMTVGEAGSETVAVLRNPREVMTTMARNQQGVVINLFNSGVIGNQLPDNLMREIQRELARRDSRKVLY